MSPERCILAAALRRAAKGSARASLAAPAMRACELRKRVAQLVSAPRIIERGSLGFFLHDRRACIVIHSSLALPWHCRQGAIPMLNWHRSSAGGSAPWPPGLLPALAASTRRYTIVNWER
jgi:hypothetical protein